MSWSQVMTKKKWVSQVVSSFGSFGIMGKLAQFGIENYK